MQLSKATHLTNGKQLQIIIIAYVSGVLSIALLAPLVGLMAFIFMIGGAVMALPVLAVAVVVVYFFKANIEKSPLKWCLTAPFVATITWLAVEFITNYSNRFDLIGYLSIRNVWERAALCFYSSGMGTYAYFHFLNRALHDNALKE